MKSLLWLLSIILINCLPSWNLETKQGKQITVWIDNDFDEKDLNEIKSALHQWSFALNGNIILSGKVIEKNLKNLNGWTILKINSGNGILKEMGKGESVMAFVDKVGGDKVYLIRDRIEDVEGTVLHEIGHLLGVEHQQNGLMDKWYNKEEYKCVDYTTLQQVAQIYKLDIDGLRYCIKQTPLD